MTELFHVKNINTYKTLFISTPSMPNSSQFRSMPDQAGLTVFTNVILMSRSGIDWH